MSYTGFDRYKGGLDTVHDLTGLHSVFTHWRSIEIMFHVSTLLPHEPNDPQKLQRKRHIGNDIVCVVFLGMFLYPERLAKGYFTMTVFVSCVWVTQNLSYHYISDLKTVV